jgi:hypothetical protein
LVAIQPIQLDQVCFRELAYSVWIGEKLNTGDALAPEWLQPFGITCPKKSVHRD